MGKNNRERRKAKKKRKDRTRRASDIGRGGPHGADCTCGDGVHFGEPYQRPPDDRATTEALLLTLTQGNDEEIDRRDVINLLISTNAVTVHEAVESLLARQLSWLWGNHWLPGEILRQVRRTVSAKGSGLAAAAIAADHAKRKPEALHPLWQEHVDELDLPSTRPERWYRSFSDEAALSATEMIVLPTDVMRALDLGVVLEELIPPPGSKARAATTLADRRPTADPILEKVRNLLAQAESTNFDAEAEAFTTKAQELMARHSLDEAVVWSRGEKRDGPVVTRIAVDDPYADAKRLLLHVVAGSSNCRSIFRTELALATIVGFEADVRATETLFTSLALQAQRSLQRAAASAPPGSHSRSRTFRSSFLRSYADRISERLEEINSHVREEAESSSGEDLLPVLASRSMAVDDDVERRFGRLEHSTIRAPTDIEGVVAGRQAANEAELTKTVHAHTT